MTDVGKALEAAATAITNEELKDAEWPWHDRAARAAILAFLRAMPDQREIPVEQRVAGVPVIRNYPSVIIAAIEKEIAP